VSGTDTDRSLALTAASTGTRSRPAAATRGSRVRRFGEWHGELIGRQRHHAGDGRRDCRRGDQSLGRALGAPHQRDGGGTVGAQPGHRGGDVRHQITRAGASMVEEQDVKPKTGEVAGVGPPST